MKTTLRFIAFAIAISAATQTVYNAYADRELSLINIDTAEVTVANYMTAIRAARKTGQPLILSNSEKKEFENALGVYMKQNQLKNFPSPSDRLKESSPDKPGV